MNIPRSDLRDQIAHTFAGGFAIQPAGVGGYVTATDTTSFGSGKQHLPGLVEEPQAGPSYEHLFRFVSGAAWAVTPEVLAVIKDMLTYRMAGHRLTDAELHERIGASGVPQAARRRSSSAPARRGGVALMSLYGVISPRASMVENVSGPSGTGLDSFSRQLSDALDDPDIESIVIDVNSPGGTVDMVPETAERIREARTVKPVYAVANTEAGSAAYWLMSQATEAIATPSGSVGSIGVYSMHQDVSVANEMKGRRVSLISAGKFKVEGNPFETLSQEARDAIQANVDGYYDWFVGDVARGRGVKSSVVRSGYGEGRMLGAKQALAAGMIDRVETLDQTVRRALNGGKPPRGRVSSSGAVSLAGDELAVEAPEEGTNVPIDLFPNL